MADNLKTKTLNAMVWSSVQTFGTLVLTFATNLILARLLTPADFGCIGMLLLFIELSKVFIDGGFGSAIIQRKNITQADLSTVFFWNLAVSVLFVIVLYFSAPAVANFYNIPLLKDILRVQSISLIINAFILVQGSKLKKELRFKILSIRSIVSTVIGATVGIGMAFAGYGVWSLVGKELIAGFFSVILLWSIAKWKPSFVFSWTSFKSLFSFGSKIFLSYMTETIYNNIQTLIIGKAFSIKELGFYTQAKKLEGISANSLTTIVSSVTFPVFSSISEDLGKLKNVVRRNLKTINYITFPLMILLITIAKPLIIFLFTEKWALSIPFFQILCIPGMLSPLNQANTQIFKAIGRSDVFFQLQFVKRLIGIILIFFSVRYGIWALMWTIAVNNFIFYAMNIYYTQKYLRYNVKEQLQDIMPNLLLSLTAGIGSYLLLMQISHLPNLLLVLTTTLCFVIIYVLFSYLFKVDSFDYLLKTIFKSKFQ